MPDLLLELRSEEIPAAAQRPAAAALERELAAALGESGLPPRHTVAWSTPRRIAVRMSGLPAARPASRTECRGPRVDAPDSAIDGFCRANRLDRTGLETRETPKGRFYFAVLERPPVPAELLLREVIPEAVSRVPWRKSMRWGTDEFRWIRPLRGLLCVFDGKAVAVDVGGLTASMHTAGHRFLAPDGFTLGTPADYSDELLARKVLLDPDARRERILSHGREQAARAGLTLAADDDLVDELTGLTEWPVVMIGRFEESFLTLPPEVLATTLRRHQRYLPLSRSDGAPAASFLMVADIEPQDGGTAVVAGNERVLRARLQDAAFFWQADRKLPLEERIPALAEIGFHAQLGSMADKARRLESLARLLARKLGWGPEPSEAAAAAAHLAKADLTTDLVGEFPELQGVIGGHLARAQGLAPDTATAVAEHYRPLGPRDRCPSTPVAALVALTDKLDTLVGFFWKGERPTGSGDPLALRRTALGLIRIALEHDIRLPVDDLVQSALAIHSGDADPDPARPEWVEVRRDLRAFLKERLRVVLRSGGAPHDHVAATLNARGGMRDLPGLADQVPLLSRFLATREGATLQALYRRSANIVKIEARKYRDAAGGNPDPHLVDEPPAHAFMAPDPHLVDEPDLRLLDQPEERALYEALQKHGWVARQHLEAGRFLTALEALARLGDPLDRFFEAVRVNTEDADLRANRLRLLAALEHTIAQVADFSKLKGGETGRHG